MDEEVTERVREERGPDGSKGGNKLHIQRGGRKESGSDRWIGGKGREEIYREKRGGRTILGERENDIRREGERDGGSGTGRERERNFDHMPRERDKLCTALSRA